MAKAAPETHIGGEDSICLDLELLLYCRLMKEVLPNRPSFLFILTVFLLILPTSDAPRMQV